MISTSRPEWRHREDLSLAEVLYVLWGRRLLVALAVLVFVALALAFSLSRESSYTAQSTISVAPIQPNLSQVEREVFLEDVSGVVASDDLTKEAAERTGWQGGLADFRERLEPDYFVRENGESGLVVRFSAETPEEAAEAANAYAGLFAEKVEQLNERRLAGGTLNAEARVVSRAEPSEVRAGRRPLLYAAIAVCGGVLAGGAAALLLEGRARSWRGVRDAEMTLHAPVIGAIPDYFSLERD